MPNKKNFKHTACLKFITHFSALKLIEAIEACSCWLSLGNSQQDPFQSQSQAVSWNAQKLCSLALSELAQQNAQPENSHPV